jgi:ribA/ribD-fused uncharacterized protein
MDKLTKTFERITDNHVFFWGGPLSNWAPSKFEAEVDGNKLMFNNTEQYFMYRKAVEFGDEETAALIMIKGSDPKTAKMLGRRVRNYDDKKWDEIRYGVMKEANIAKYMQNEEFASHLLSEEFSGKTFVEGSTVDTIWGIGVHWKEAEDDESNWKGRNLLGQILCEVRDYIKENFKKKS